MHDPEAFYRQLISEARRALSLPPMESNGLGATARRLAESEPGRQAWEAVQSIGTERYLLQFGQITRTIAEQAMAMTWAERVEHGAKQGAQLLKNPAVLVGALLGVQMGFKLLEKVLDDRSHHQAAQMRRDVTRLLETAAITGNVPMVGIAQMGHRLLDDGSKGGGRRDFSR